MANNSIDDDIEWLLHDFQENNMSKNDLKESTISTTSAGASSAFSFLFGSQLTRTRLPTKTYPEFPRDPYVEKADLSLLGNIFKDNVNLVPGSIVAVSLAFVFEHTGIYIGNGEFIELYGDGSINKVDKNNFINGAYRNNDFPVRTGVNIYVAAIKNRPIVADRAKEMAIKLYKEVKQINYNVLKNNCHMFTGFCVFGKDFQKNHGCRFFTNLTRAVIDELSPSINDFYWRMSDHSL